MIRSKKMLLVLLVILVLFMFTSRVSAVVYDYNGSTIELPNVNYNHYVVLKRGSEFFLMVLDSVYSKDLYVIKTDDSAFLYCGDKNSKQKEYNPTKVDFPCYNCTEGSSEWSGGSYGGWTAGQCNVVYSTEDIYYTGEVFFQKAPLEETTLAKITRESHPEEVVIQVLKILPLIIVVVVSFLGLRKAWRLLSKILHQA